MMRIIIRTTATMLFLCLALGVSACNTAPKSAPPQPDTYWPTPESPIILKKGQLIFGGEKGTERETMKWQSPPSVQVVSPGGKLAAVVFAQEKETVVEVISPEREIIRKIHLADGRKAVSIAIGDGGHILAGISDITPRPAEPPLPGQGEGKANPVKWVFIGLDDKTKPVDLKGAVYDTFVFADGRWVAFAYNADTDSFTLSCWREAENLWSKEIKKQDKNAVGYYMSVVLKGDARVVISWSQGIQCYDMEGRQLP